LFLIIMIFSSFLLLFLNLMSFYIALFCILLISSLSIDEAVFIYSSALLRNLLLHGDFHGLCVL
jgi:hypothetical protein